MKYPNTCFAFLALAVAVPAGVTTASAQVAGSRDPIVITPPAVPNGSNSSRAPFVAERRFDDVKPADGQAIDQDVPPNTPATDPEPNPLPTPTVAIFQPAPTPFADPGLLPTGRPTAGVATSLNATQTAATIRAGVFESREQMLADVEARINVADTAMRGMRSSVRQMSAEGRTQFRAAEDQVKQTERALRNSIKAARKASATEWESARAQLASAFEAYAAALAHVDAVAGVAPAY